MLFATKKKQDVPNKP